MSGRYSVIASICALMVTLAFTSNAVTEPTLQIAQQTVSPAEALIRINRVDVSIPDVDVIDQDGRRVRFHTDLVKGRILLISFFYTSCVYTCTAQGKNLASLQKVLREKLGREVFFISISTDPERDTPVKLKKWGNTFGAKSGWTLVTGDKISLEKLRQAFPGVRAGRDVHESLLFIGNDARGFWIRADGLRPNDEIVSLVQAVAEKD